MYNISSSFSSSVVRFCKISLVCCIIFYLISIILLNHPISRSTEVIFPFKLSISSSNHEPNNLRTSTSTDSYDLTTLSGTDINHLMFGLLGSVNTWKHRRTYIESWWRPNITYGFLYLDYSPTQELLPWPSSSPPFRVSEDNTRFLKESKHVAPMMMRMVRGIIEAMREKKEGLRWLIMGDDDTIFFLDNLVDLLSTFDHTNYVYIGCHSESIKSNSYFSFHNGFGGAGFILSAPLAEAMALSLDDCMKRHTYLLSADQITSTCAADIGVDLTSDRGIHQVDLRGDISGFLFGHPQSPLISLHHFDIVEPIFPTLNRSESANHLVKRAARLDQSRMLQQTVCYDKQNNWSIAISWGYSSHIYENIIPRSILRLPIETFTPWLQAERPYYIFDTRSPNNDDPCQAPHVFYFNSTNLETDKENRQMIITSYSRFLSRGLSACSFTGNHSADYINTIKVLSPSKKLKKIGRSECCDVSDINKSTNAVLIKYRSCRIDEIIA